MAGLVHRLEHSRQMADSAILPELSAQVTVLQTDHFYHSIQYVDLNSCSSGLIVRGVPTGRTLRCFPLNR